MKSLNLMNMVLWAPLGASTSLTNTSVMYSHAFMLFIFLVHGALAIGTLVQQSKKFEVKVWLCNFVDESCTFDKARNGSSMMMFYYLRMSLLDKYSTNIP